jgi:hypothetical protein
VGFHQAGASSAQSAQNAFFDFFIIRPLSHKTHVFDARWNLWGNVRIASSPRQLNIPVSQFAAGFAAELGKTQVNELAQSAEFLSGFELRLATFRQGSRRRMLGGVGFFGANGSLSDPLSQGALFKVPKAGTPNGIAFDAAYPGFPRPLADYVALVPPDRERFYRQYGAGIRLTSFDLRAPLAPPATYMATVGQDQLITSGRYQGAVFRVDVFYPLPVGKENGQFKSLFLFGTTNMRIARPFDKTPLAMERVCAGSSTSNCTGSAAFWGDRTAVIAVPSARDTYRLGVGIDFVNLLTSWLTKP